MEFLANLPGWTELVLSIISIILSIYAIYIVIKLYKNVDKYDNDNDKVEYSTKIKIVAILLLSSTITLLLAFLIRSVRWVVYREFV